MSQALICVGPSDLPIVSCLNEPGIYLWDRGVLKSVVRDTDLQLGTSETFLGAPVLNDAGQIAFVASGVIPDVDGVYLYNGNEPSGSQLKRIAATGEATPSGDTFFHQLSLSSVATIERNRPALNEAGQVAFIASLIDASSNDRGLGIYVYDAQQGLTQVVQTGDSLLGGRVDSLDFWRHEFVSGTDRRGINDLGQVAFQFLLDDGRNGIAVWTVPEPNTWPLAIAGILALVLIAFRRS